VKEAELWSVAVSPRQSAESWKRSCGPSWRASCLPDPLIFVSASRPHHHAVSGGSCLPRRPFAEVPHRPVTIRTAAPSSQECCSPSDPSGALLDAGSRRSDRHLCDKQLMGGSVTTSSTRLIGGLFWRLPIVAILCLASTSSEASIFNTWLPGRCGEHGHPLYVLNIMAGCAHRKIRILSTMYGNFFLGLSGLYR